MNSLVTKDLVEKTEKSIEEILSIPVEKISFDSRVPVDDPATHLELTMIHEVMILDNSGSDLALLTWANGIKMLLISSLIAYMIIPSGVSDFVSVLLYLGVIALLSMIIGTVESGMARIRMSHVFEFVFIMSSLALVVLSLVMARMFGG